MQFNHGAILLENYIKKKNNNKYKESMEKLKSFLAKDNEAQYLQTNVMKPDNVLEWDLDNPFIGYVWGDFSNEENANKRGLKLKNATYELVSNYKEKLPIHTIITGHQDVYPIQILKEKNLYQLYPNEPKMIETLKFIYADNLEELKKNEYEMDSTITLSGAVAPKLLPFIGSCVIHKDNNDTNDTKDINDTNDTKDNTRYYKKYLELKRKYIQVKRL